ncbi:helical backbone metal receptor [Desulfocastanea catecholica]
MKRLPFILIFLLLLQPVELLSGQWPVTFTDSSGTQITLDTVPRRVVSLVPSITEIVLGLGGADALVGITSHSLLPPKTADKEIIGGFFRPDLDRVAGLQPDVIFYADLHEEQVTRFRDKAILIRLTPRTIAESFEQIRLLGRIFNKEAKGAAIITEQQRQLEVIALKVAKIPAAERQRVIRLMGDEPFMVPGDDSFQNEYIRAAGGIAPKFGANGNSIPITLAQWQQFNAQVIYGCGSPDQALAALQQPGWRDVDAVRHNRVLFFPCELTCRLAGQSGTLVSALSSGIYSNSFSSSDNYVLNEEVVARQSLHLDLDYLRQAEIITSNMKDFHNKTLALSFKAPMRVVSTLEGQKEGILTVANHYFPPPSWGLDQGQGLAELRKSTSHILGLAPDTTAMLFTGADMDNLAVVRKSFRDMEVVALVTAGVEGNSVRMGSDTGSYYEPGEIKKTDKPGTINILLLTNMQLSPRAMTRAIISSTEAKSAALQDLDIRSSYTSPHHAATGTGTDNIIVVEGSGPAIDATGGHTKMGELIGRAVYDGVQEAIARQNGLTAKRSIFKRLEERKIDLSAVCQGDPRLRSDVEQLLLQPRYSSLLAAALAISDDYERGLVSDLTSFDDWCGTLLPGGQPTAGAALPAVATSPDSAAKELPLVIRKALAVVLGAAQPATPATKPPERIISLGPTNTENVYLIGAEDRLVANTSYCIRPEAAKTKEKIGSVMQISIEKILSLQPDLVLATDLSPPQQLEKLRNLGLNVVQFHQATSFDDICTQFITLGRLLGLEQRAHTIVSEARAKVAAITRDVSGLPIEKVFLQIGSQPLVGALPNTFTDDFIALSGGVNIIDDQPSGTTNYEKVLAENPDTIIIAIMGNETGLAGKELERWRDIPVIKAVRDGRVHIIDPDLVCSPSPATFAEALAIISRLIHPDLNQRARQ